MARSARAYTAHSIETRDLAVQPDATPSHPGLHEPTALAQGVTCGPWWLAFPFSWARSVVDDFELTEVPHAPPWLAGAANVDGRVIPVFDLVRYLDPTQPPPTGPGALLLVGGEGEHSAAILFRGLPATARPMAGLAPPDTPAGLAEFVIGAATDNRGQAWALVDADALMEALSAELALA
ncbi:chemotaxis protein CheW [Caldimonas brevitalea]|uniref:CheW-like domain-containing protein n=1 Tax=Caldimonas brevitalea TaxID=413882 RepID=A0A0G3BRI1_9BURK|nr:chemotaxis protein CheW [Caldimonas brevitalea]AKJ32039.1 hypothetical protein AAW51_5348 [Caldimonas brevitalea]